jgi:replicative DNA helicase
LPHKEKHPCSQQGCINRRSNQMSEQTPSASENYNPDSNEWAQVQRVKDELTRQRDKLAKSHRMYEAGESDGLDPLCELRSVQDAIRKAMPNLAQAGLESGPTDVLVRDLITDYWEQVEQRKNTVSTGFGALDDILSGGIESRRLICVLGAPNTGKTTFVHQVADSIACSGRPVFYVTSEDSPIALFSKTLPRIGGDTLGLSYTAVLKGWKSKESEINVALAMQMDRPSTDRLCYLDATNGLTFDVIREKARAHFARYTAENGGGPGILVVDYLQRIARSVKAMSGLSADLRETVSTLTDRLRALAYELNCGVIAIASQNRMGYTRSESTGAMASAKESGDVEYTCDVLMALTEDKDRTAPKGMTAIKLHVDKNRQGQRGKIVNLNFYPDRQQFTKAEQ